MSEEITGRGWAFPPSINNRGGLALASSQADINQAIQIILMTSPGQRVMRPTFGCRLHELVFAPNDGQTAAAARRYVEEALAMWEPRINVQQVEAYPSPENHNCLLIEIAYEVKNTHDRRSLVHPFYVIPEE